MSNKYHYETKEVCVSETGRNWAIFHAFVAITSLLALFLMFIIDEHIATFNIISQIIIFVANALLCGYRLTDSYEIRKIRVYEDEMTEDEKVKQQLLGK